MENEKLKEETARLKRISRLLTEDEYIMQALFDMFIDTVMPYFRRITPENFGIEPEEIFEDHVEEASILISDWYKAESYYGKPEDILQEYFGLTPIQAHYFLPLFKE